MSKMYCEAFGWIKLHILRPRYLQLPFGAVCQEEVYQPKLVTSYAIACKCEEQFLVWVFDKSLVEVHDYSIYLSSTMALEG